jgi:hypothetical protein
VPEAGAGRRVGVVTGDGEAFRPRRRVRSPEMRRFAAPGAAEAEIRRQDEILRQIVAVLETVADDRERHVPSPFAKSISRMERKRATRFSTASNWLFVSRQDIASPRAPRFCGFHLAVLREHMMTRTTRA